MPADMDALYRDYARSLWKFLRTLGCDAQTAEDLVQETFYQAIRSIDRYDGSCRLSVWLCQIARHLYLRELDRRRRRGCVELSETIPDDAPSLVDALIAKEERQVLIGIIAELPELQRQVVRYRVDGNMHFREIGHVMGRSENWARVTYFRAKEKIIERWRELDGTDET